MQLDQIFAHVGRTWKHLGATEPHWSVMGWDEYKPDKINETIVKFYAGGETDLHALRFMFARCGHDVANVASCLEYGCGVGRVTSWLSGVFERVHAVDVSAAHMGLAQQYLQSKAVANVDWHLLKSINEVSDLPTVDFVYSLMVLQHNPPPVIVYLLAQLSARVRPGGYLLVQIPSYIPNYEFKIDRYLAQPPSEQEMEMHILPQHIVLPLLRSCGLEVLSVVQDWSAGVTIGSHTYFAHRPA